MLKHDYQNGIQQRERERERERGIAGLVGILTQCDTTERLLIILLPRKGDPSVFVNVLIHMITECGMGIHNHFEFPKRDSLLVLFVFSVSLLVFVPCNVMCYVSHSSLLTECCLTLLGCDHSKHQQLPIPKACLLLHASDV